MTTKGYNYPKKIKIALAKIFSWFGILIISHLGRFVNMFIEIFKNTFREVEKVPPFTQGSLFYVHLYLINFPDKHCICVHRYI